MRFTLRTILALMTAVALLATLALYLTRDYRKQMAVRADLRELGASFVRLDPESETIFAVFTAPITPEVLDRYANFEQIELQGFQLTGQSVTSLSRAEHLKMMMIQSCKLEGADIFQDARHLTELQTLLIWSTPADDTCLEHVAAIPNLKTLSLSSTKITQRGVDHLRQQRPDLTIDFRP